MKKLIYIVAILCSFFMNGQSIKTLLKKYNTESVAYTKVEELKASTGVVLLDAREPKEYKVSHIKNAICVGYDYFDLEKTMSKLRNKNDTIVVYCSVGIRSEDIAEKLQKAGYKNVFNLYGGIFEWKNNQNLVVDSLNKPTEKVHTFNKEWSKWLKKGEKVYE